MKSFKHHLTERDNEINHILNQKFDTWQEFENWFIIHKYAESQMIGQGSFAKVFDNGQGKYVFKVGRDNDDAWLDYAKVCEVNTSRYFSPIITVIPLQEGYISVIERVGTFDPWHYDAPRNKLLHDFIGTANTWSLRPLSNPLRVVSEGLNNMFGTRWAEPLNDDLMSKFDVWAGKNYDFINACAKIDKAANASYSWDLDKATNWGFRKGMSGSQIIMLDPVFIP